MSIQGKLVCFVSVVAFLTLGCDKGTSSSRTVIPSGTSIRRLSDKEEVLNDLIDLDAYVYEFSGTFLELWLECELEDTETKEKKLLPSFGPATIAREAFEGRTGSIAQKLSGKIVVWESDGGSTLRLRVSAEVPQAEPATTGRQGGTTGVAQFTNITIPAIPKASIDGPTRGGTSSAGGDIPDVVELPKEAGKEFTILWYSREEHQYASGTTTREKTASRKVTVRLKGRLLAEQVPKYRNEPDDSAAVATLKSLDARLDRYDTGSVRTVYFGTGSKVSDDDLAQLRGLPNLESLEVHSPRITDTGFGRVKTLTTLKKLDARSTNVTDAGLEHLKGLSALETLNLHETKVTHEGVQELEQALPRCRILGGPAEPGAEPESQPSEDERAHAAAAQSSSASGKLLGAEYVPPDAMFVSVLSPQRILSRPELADAPIERLLQKIGHLDRSVEMPVPTRFLIDMGIPLKDVEQAICVVTGFRATRDARLAVSQNAQQAEDTGRPHQVVGAPDRDAAEEIVSTPDDEPVEMSEVEHEEFFDTADVEENTGPDPEQDSWLYGPLMEAYVLRLTGPAPREEAVGLLFRPKRVTLGGKTYYGQGEDTGAVAVHFPDERTMIVGEELVVRKMLAYEEGPSALAEALEKTDHEADILGAINVTAVREQLTRRTETNEKLQGPVNDTIAAFSIRLDPRPSIKAVVHTKDSEAGAEIVELVRSGIATAREKLAAISRRHAEPQIQELRSLARDLFTRGLNSLKVDRVEECVEITLRDFAPLTDLTSLLNLFNATTLQYAQAPLPTVPAFDGDTTAAAIRRLIPAAAGCRAEVLCAIARSPTTPKPSNIIKDVGLSVFVMMYKIPPPGIYEIHAEEFRFDAQALPRPNDLAREFLRSRHLGYYSTIHADRITDFTCDVDGDTAKGSVTFEVPRLYEGKVQYLAERVAGHWRIKEFHLPIHRWRFVRTEDGQWTWFNMFGDLGDLIRNAGHVSPRWPGHPVSGKITLDGKPVTEATIEFFHTVDVFYPGGLAFLYSGTYRTDLPAGSYHVAIRSSKPEVPERYRTPGRSGLKIEVREGENTIDFDLGTE